MKSHFQKINSKYQSTSQIPCSFLQYSYISQQFTLKIIVNHQAYLLIQILTFQKSLAFKMIQVCFFFGSKSNRMRCTIIINLASQNQPLTFIFKNEISSNCYNNRVSGFEMQKEDKVGKINIEEMKVPTVSNNCALAILVIGTLLICLIMILNVFIDTPLFMEGINFIYKYQNAQPYGIIQKIQNFFSLLCNPIGVGAVLVIYYIIVNRKLMLIVHLSFFLFTTYIIALLKQAFQQSRPIWYDDRIRNWEWFCPKDFGNPSGHSFAVILLYQPIISDSIGYWNYRPWGYVLVLLVIMIPISRMYLGVHSLNQILFGLSMGTVFLVMFKYIYQKALYELYWEFLLRKARKVKLFGIFILNLIVIGIPIAFFYINTKERPMLEKDINNLNKQCGTNMTGYEVQAHMLTACAIGCFAFGLVYGFVLLMNQPGYRKYLLGLWGYESPIKVVLKIGIYLISAGVPFLFFYLIAYFATKGSYYWTYILYCFAMTGAGIGLSYLAPFITSKCNIMKLLPGSAQDYQHRLDEIHD